LRLAQLKYEVFNVTHGGDESDVDPKDCAEILDAIFRTNSLYPAEAESYHLLGKIALRMKPHPSEQVMSELKVGSSLLWHDEDLSKLIKALNDKLGTSGSNGIPVRNN
jgi:hypothetical protein